MKKVLILGSLGMAGHVTAHYLEETKHYQIIRCARGGKTGHIDLDVIDFSRLSQVLQEQQPDIVVNCIGLLVTPCELHPDLAILINSYLPTFLSRKGTEFNFKLIHISTDCVFSGSKGQYLDTDFRDGDTLYARSKALGEIQNKRDLTIRTSIIGPELKANGTGLFHWFMQQHGRINGYARAYWSGVTTLELAKMIDEAIQQNLTGLYQLSMPEKISKYELLNLFREIWEKNDVDIIPDYNYSCDKSLVPSRSEFHYALPQSYRIMLCEQKAWMEKHPNQ